MTATDRERIGRKEAAELCGVHQDTITRAIAHGKLPNARKEGGPNGHWQIPVTDLVNAGMLQLDPKADFGGQLGRTRMERELHEAREQLIRAEARLESLAAIVERQRDEVDFLRKLVRAA